MNIEKAKDKARKFELKEQYGQAIELYTRIIDALEGTPDLDSELALFNKVGDLYLKVGNVASAVEMYERAANRYAESGLSNNAIALCNKILRNAPGRTQVYLKLAKLMVQRGFVAEAKQNLLEYADRMQRAGRLDEAFRALKEFADLSPGNEELRAMLVEQLKAAAKSDQAREQLGELYAEIQSSGDTGRQQAAGLDLIDPEYDVEAARESARRKAGDLVFLDLDDTPGATAPAEPASRRATPPPRRATPPPAPPEEEKDEEELVIEPTSLAEEEVEAAPERVEDDELGIERASAELAVPEDVEAEPVDGLDTGAAFGADASDADPLDLEPAAPGLEVPELDLEGLDEDEEEQEEEEAPPVPTLDIGVGEIQRDVGIGDFSADIFMPTVEPEAETPEPEPPPERYAEASAFDAPPAEAEAPDIATLETLVADDPDDPDRHRQLGEALIEHGDRGRGLEELDIALATYEVREDWSRAEGMAEEILRLDPNSIRHHQKRVEYAFRKGVKGRLIQAYIGLADALFRSGAVERARAVYERVLEHDPGNEQARTALETLEPSEEAGPAGASATSSTWASWCSTTTGRATRGCGSKKRNPPATSSATSR